MPDDIAVARQLDEICCQAEAAEAAAPTFATIRQAIVDAGKDGAIAMLIDGLLRADTDAAVSPTQEAQLIQLGSKITSIGKRDIARELRQRRQAREERRQLQREVHDNRRRILVISALRHEATDAGLTALLAAGVPLFQRNKTLVRCATVPGKASDGSIVRVPAIIPLTRSYLERELGKAAEWIKINKSGTSRRIDRPADVSARILSMAGEWAFPPLVGIISTQTMRPNGSLLLTEGYDQATGYFLVAPPPMQPMPERPTIDDARESLALLRDLLSGFPFAANASRSVGLSGVMTPVLRAAMLVAPGHAISAPEPGSGKSYLMDIVAMVGTGDRCPVLSLPKKNPEEIEKRLNAIVLAGQPIISLDNMTVRLEGDFLCQMMERPVLITRPLGSPDMPKVQNSFSVYANGNNLEIADDVAVWRVIRASLDASVENTTKLTYASPTPSEKITADRGKYVRAILVVGRAYVAAGSPNLSKLPSYEGWCQFVRSPLIWLGEADPVETMAEVREDNPHRVETAAVFTALLEEMPLTSELLPTPDKAGWLTKEILDRTREQDANSQWVRPKLRDALLAVAGGGRPQCRSDRPQATRQLVESQQK